MERLTRNKIKSSLPFQIILHINLWFFPIWLLTVFVNLDFRYSNITDIYNAIMLIIFLILSVCESLKLYLGYLGNLGGKIPELAACWLISTLIQFPLEMFLVFNYETLSLHNNLIVNCFMICLLFLEIITGAIALRNLADLRAKIFYLAQLYNRCNRC
ncbi:transmembrane protein 17B [Nomia melanderi]|uniref:transmembrane protein 17B n=1 Tax=Nomia melanderi TaxID=2448451 RepID=UPI0013044BAA|nr:transmembrane protein 17B-like [Nomia melanderi]